MVGRVIGEKYLVRSKLGEGGMGAVYLVRHTHLEQDFALKVLNPDLAANQNFRERFLREAKAATAFLMITLAWVMLKIIPLDPLYPTAGAGVFVVLSGIVYFRKGLRQLKEHDHD